jgi:RHS repeat-associated protein
MAQCFTHSISPSPRLLAESYTFSAKERDSETGLSYFGSRYYSSDLSIWLSVDPMSDKYASLSPYVYRADNPVKLVDPNGDSIINGYKEAYFYFLKQYTDAREKLNAFGNDNNADGYNEAKINYDKSVEDYNTISFLYKTIEVARSNVEKYNEELYNQMNSIENGSNFVDIRLYIDYSLDRYNLCEQQTVCIEGLW